MEFLKIIVTYVRQKKWECVAIILLLLLIIMLGTLLFRAVPIIIRQTTTTVIQEELKPIKESLLEVQSSLSEINDWQVETTYNSGVAAYKKFSGLSGSSLATSLESNAQNAIATKNALVIPEVRERLRQIDPQLTIELINYWQIQIS